MREYSIPAFFFLSENLENDLCILDDLLGLVIYTYLNGM